MEDATPLFIFVTVIACFWAIQVYNKFVKYRNMIEEGWSIIDVALKRRANLIPKLVAAVRGYQAHEAEVLENIAQQRTGGNQNPAANPSGERDVVGQNETELSRSLGNLLAVAESNPDLKASSNFIDLQDALDQVEQEIASARNKFNARIRAMNTLVEQFPSNVIAHLFKFRRENYFKIELATERDVPETPWDAT